MSALVICASKHHGNTRRVADRIGGVLGAPVMTPGEVTVEQIDAADLVGFGSGVYWMAFDPDVIRLVSGLSAKPRGTAFVYATSGLPETPLRRYTLDLADRLTECGFQLAPEAFLCRGLDTMGPLRLIGGVNKGRPDDTDLLRAEVFAQRLAAQCA